VVSAQVSAAHGRQPGHMCSCEAQTHGLLPSGHGVKRRRTSSCHLAMIVFISITITVA